MATPLGHPRGAAALWTRFRRGPFFPACVLLLILATAAGLFAGSYTYAMANPTPRHIPTGVVFAGGKAVPNGEKFAGGMEQALNTSLQIRLFPDYASARDALEDQQIFVIMRSQGNGVHMDVASAAGSSVAQLLAQAGPAVGRKTGTPVTVTDLKPLQRGDPRGLAMFYITLAAVILGFVGAIQLSVHAAALNPGERVLFTAAHAVLGSFAICAVVDWLLGAVRLPFPESWAILALTMFASAMVFTMFNTLVHRWAMIPTWGLMVLLGNPSSGGAVSWALLPSVLGAIGRWLPPGASVNAQHTAVYFPHHQHAFPFAVLGCWAVLGTAVFWTWRHRHPGGRAPGPQERSVG